MDTVAPLTIQYGDWIIIYSVSLVSQALLALVLFPHLFTNLQNRTQVSSDIVTQDKEVQSRYGHFKHNLMVGKPWGIKVSSLLSFDSLPFTFKQLISRGQRQFPSSNGKGFVYLLKPTPELWSVERRDDP